MGNEHALMDQLLLQVGGSPGIRLFRVNSGTAKSFYGDRIVRLAPKGTADLIGIVEIPCSCNRQNRGIFLAIEAKAGRGRQTKEQAAFQRMVDKLGGIYVLARSVEDVFSCLEARGYVRAGGVHGSTSGVGGESAQPRLGAYCVERKNPLHDRVAGRTDPITRTDPGVGPKG